MKKLRILALVLALCMAFNGFAVAASAEEQSTGGTWENITWSYDAQTGQLRVWGEGGMPSKWPIYFPWKGLAPKSIVIEEGITSVARQAFELNSKLTSISLPNSLKSIELDAFCQTGLTSVRIPAGVTDMAVGAFDHSDSLKEYVVDPANTTYCNDEHGVLLSKDMTKLWDIPDGFEGDYVVPDTVTSMYRRAFYGVDGLTGLTFPAGADIPFDDIDQTPNLKKIIVDPAHPDYSNDAKGVLFNKDKTELLKIPQAYEGHYDIPEGVVKLGERSLPTAGCSKLTSLSIPASTTAIEYYWDYGLFPGAALEKITVHKDNPNYCDDRGVLYDKEMTELLRMPRGFKGTYTVSASVKKITFESVGGCEQLTSITIMGELDSISANAFVDSKNLKEIWFKGNAPKKFGYDCFYDLTFTAYYPEGNATWTEKVMSDTNHGGNVTWKADPCSVAHTEVSDAGKDATCTENGLTDGKHCSVCGVVIMAQQTISAKGHQYGQWVEVQKPTVEKTGLSQRSCAVCGDTQDKILDKLPAPDVDPTEPVVTDPTEPSVTDPTEPVVTDPTEPSVTDPTEPSMTNPTEPSQTEPAQTQPAQTEPTTSRPKEETGNEATVVIVVVAVVAVLGGGGTALFFLMKKFHL